jgi:hypothetical protein
MDAWERNDEKGMRMRYPIGVKEIQKVCIFVHLDLD